MELMGSATISIQIRFSHTVLKGVQKARKPSEVEVTFT